MTTMLARITVKPGQADAFAAMQRRMSEATWAEGPCRVYETFRLAEPGQFLVLMGFDDHAGFMAHQLTPLHVEAPWGELVETLEMHFLDPVAGASTLPPSVPVPLAAPDELSRQMQAMFAYERAAWWPAPVAETVG